MEKMKNRKRGCSDYVFLRVFLLSVSVSASVSKCVYVCVCVYVATDCSHPS